MNNYFPTDLVQGLVLVKRKISNDVDWRKANKLTGVYDRPAVFIEQTHLDKQPAELTDC